MKKKISKRILLILYIMPLLFILALKCYSQKVEYDIEILYTTVDEGKLSCKNDSLPMFVGSGFNNDTIEIYINGKKRFNEIVKTRNTTGLAKYLYISDYKKTDYIGIRINRGPLAYIETNRKYYQLGVDFEFRNKLIVTFNRNPFDFH